MSVGIRWLRTIGLGLFYALLTAAIVSLVAFLLSAQSIDQRNAAISEIENHREASRCRAYLETVALNRLLEAHGLELMRPVDLSEVDCGTLTDPIGSPAP